MCPHYLNLKTTQNKGGAARAQWYLVQADHILALDAEADEVARAGEASSAAAVDHHLDGRRNGTLRQC